MGKTPAHCPEDQKIIDELRKQVDDLNRKLENLRKEFDEYRVRHPGNVGVKSGKPYEYRSESKQAADGDPLNTANRRPGARIRNKGYHRPAADHVDGERKISITQCPHCRSDLSESATTRTRIIEDIPVIKPAVIRYAIERRYCLKCKRIVEPEINDALPNAPLSLRAMLVMGYMKTVERLPAARVSGIMNDIFGLSVTEGEIMNIIHLLSKHLGRGYRSLVRRVRKAGARYMDETSWRVSGKNMYMWAFVTEAEALYVIGSRSHEVPEKVLGKHSGTDMHDGFSAYATLAKITKNPQAWCWAHIIRDAEELIEYNESEGRYILGTLKRVFDRAKKLLDKPVESITESDMQSLHEGFLQIDIPCESRKCAGFVRNMLKRKRDELFRFVIDRSVESTNNRAERAIRPIVVYRKVSGGSRSEKGGKDFTRVYSVLESQRKRGKLSFRADPG